MSKKYFLQWAAKIWECGLGSKSLACGFKAVVCLKKDAWWTTGKKRCPLRESSLRLPMPCPVQLSELIRHPRMSGIWYFRTNTDQRKILKEGSRCVTSLHITKVRCICQLTHACLVFSLYYRSLGLHQGSVSFQKAIWKHFFSESHFSVLMEWGFQTDHQLLYPFQNDPGERGSNPPSLGISYRPARIPFTWKIHGGNGLYSSSADGTLLPGKQTCSLFYLPLNF